LTLGEILELQGQTRLALGYFCRAHEITASSQPDSGLAEDALMAYARSLIALGERKRAIQELYFARLEQTEHGAIDDMLRQLGVEPR